MNLGTRIFTWLHGELVGTDAGGNRYYREKQGRALIPGGGFDSRERRWVGYAGEPEATKVPAEWHGWLHHVTDQIPDAKAQARPIRPRDAVITPAAARTGHRPKATGDYEAWTP
jgi:NADH:ubiquinone oxidoreductase subunit